MQGLSVDLLVIAFSGVGLAFGMWWMYFMLPSGEVLHHERDRKAFPWGYGHIPVFGAIAAVGAGLHVAAYAVEDPEHVSVLRAVVAVAVPIALYLLAVGVLGVGLVGWAKSRFEVLTLLGSLGAIAIAVALAAAGAPLAVCLLLVTLAPAIQIVGDEVTQARSRVRALERFRSAHATPGP
ncbi:low temperature requirement protein A [Agrococcus sp. ARC_14]|uniref:low temperature requirement protein A n=1 Tax=Agrococcus sp. ARC_14 TaxID=2919927 RepID=UPI003219AFBE